MSAFMTDEKLDQVLAELKKTNEFLKTIIQILYRHLPSGE